MVSRFKREKRFERGREEACGSVGREADGADIVVDMPDELAWEECRARVREARLGEYATMLISLNEQ